VAAPTGVDYRYVYIDTPGIHGRALGVSDDRTVVGYYLVNAAIEQPFVYQLAGDTSTLPLDDGMRHGGATAISRDGATIAGWEETTTGDCWAVRWVKDPAGSWTVQQLVHHQADDVNQVGCADYPVAVGDDGSVAITTAATIVAAQGSGGLLWTPGGVVTLAGQPRAMGSSGEVVGFLADPRIGARPWREVGGALLPPTGAVAAEADGLARDGTMIVSSDVGNFQRNPDGTYMPLQSLATSGVGAASRVRAISDHNEVVGDSDVAAIGGGAVGDGALPHAVRWNADGTVVDLNDVVSHDEAETLVTATAVNKSGDIVGGAMSDRTSGLEAPMLLIAMPPVIFIPGVAGSHLVDAQGDEQWINCLGFHGDLGLPPDGSTSIYADDVLRYDECGPFNSLRSDDTDAYGPFIDALKRQGGLVEYDEAKTPTRWTTAGCDRSQRANHPNLFLFPYDWRQSNSLSALELEDLMGCVREFYTGPVVVVAHSMGGLVARRYILDHPDDSHHVRDLVTIGTPWLGAPKLIRAEETGDFIPHLMTNSTVKEIVPTMPGPGQLLPSEAYYRLAPTPFNEDGWDINADGNPVQQYTHAQVDALLDTQYPNHAAISASARAFHADTTPEGSQDDWSTDNTGVNYVVMYGVHRQTDTPGPVTAGLREMCTRVSQSIVCTPVPTFRVQLVDGDGTVPLQSSTRQGNGVDLNNHDHETLIPVNGSVYGDNTTEHTGLTRNSFVQQTVLKTDGRVGFTAQSGLTAQVAPLRSALASSAQSVSSTAAPQWNVEITGLAAPTTVTAPDGSDDAIVGGTFRPALAGVSHLSEGDNAELDVIPDSGSYQVTFTAGNAPVQVDVRRGNQDAPSQHTVWQDIAVPAGHIATLTLTQGSPSLEYDSDGDGVVDSTAWQVPAGSYYPSDVTAPDLQVTSIVLNGTRQYVLHANDGESGVDTIWWSVDGHDFRKYDGPIALAAGTPLLAFADDYVGNRSDLQTFDVSAAPTAPFTTMTTLPNVAAGGWSSTPVTVHLHARASDGRTVSNITYEVGDSSHVVSGDTATFQVSEPGGYVMYYATDSAGAQEPPQWVRIGVDATPPAVTIASPAPGSALNVIGDVSGTTVDGGSAASSTEFDIERNADGAYWNGTSWQPGEIWLATAPDWSRDWWNGWWKSTVAMPAGDDLTSGAYTVRARAVDAAGNTGKALSAVTVTTVSVVTGLDTPTGHAGYPTYAFDVNDSGQVAGMVGTSSTTNPPIRWDSDGSAHLLPIDGGYYYNWTTAWSINDAGQVAGRLPNQAAIWQPDGTPVPLPGTTAEAINDKGVAAGSASGRWATWTGGAVKLLPDPPGFSSVIETTGTNVRKVGGINDAGVVVATRWMNEPGWSGQPVAAMAVPDNGTYTASYLFPPADSTTRPQASGALDVNTDGDIVGWGGVIHAPGSPGVTSSPPFLRKADGTVTWFDLGTMGLTCGMATSINDSDVIVGFGGHCGWPYMDLMDHSTDHRAFLIKNGVVEDLTSALPTYSGWQLNEAWGISNTGEITGTGTFNGHTTAFVMSLGALEAIDHAPVAADTAVTTDADTAVGITLQATDADRDQLTWSIETEPQHGSLSAVSGDAVTYTPDSGFNGTDTFVVRANDGSFASNVATVTIAVGAAAASLPPTAAIVAPAYAAEGTVFVVDGSDSLGPDGSGPLTYSWDLNGDGVFGDATTPSATASMSDDGARVVRLRVTGSSGTGETSHTITIVNVAPVVDDLGSSSGSGQQYAADGSFTDPGDDSWTATVDYGDGTGPQPLALSGKKFDLHHRYTASGSYWVTVKVCDDDGGCDERTTRIDVGGGGVVTATGTAIAATEGATFSGAVASFTYTDTSATSGQFDARVDWGDGSEPSSGVVTRLAEGGFAVGGSHTYTEEGGYQVGVTISVAGGSGATATTTATSTATVADAALHAVGSSGLASPNPVSGLTVATFTDDNPWGSASEFTASIDWGDGSVTSGVVSQTATGAFAVSGTHSYAVLGPQTVAVAISDDGGSRAAATTNLMVYGVSAGGSFVIGDGNASVGTTAQFWGARWWKANATSGGSAPADFLGYAPGVPPAACGATWTSLPGASSDPSATLPGYVAVVVTDRVTRVGSVLSGEVVHVVVVKTQPGYAPDAGHLGTGVVVATVC
jgi:pimeloyl-ACP methyl ester carboxylesterase